MKHSDDKYPKLGVFISELNLDNYKYIAVLCIAVLCIAVLYIAVLYIAVLYIIMNCVICL